MNSLSTLYKLPWVLSSSEENVYPSEKILLLLLYYFQIQLKPCTGAARASYKNYFGLYIIYFHISMSVFFPGISSFWLRDFLAVQMLYQKVGLWDLPF